MDKLAAASEPSKIFISYRWKDEPDASVRLYDALRDHFGRTDVFLDNDRMDFGEVFPERLARELEGCRILLALVGPRWLTLLQSRPPDQIDYVATEIASALERGIPVFPILIADAAMPTEEQLPEHLKRFASCLNYPIRHQYREQDIGIVIHELDRKLYGISQERTEVLPVSDTNPLGYSLPPDHVQRPDLLRQISAQLGVPGQTRKVGLAGMPGSGKTELARAYTWEYRGRYRHLVWMTGAPEDVRAVGLRKEYLSQQLEVIARDLKLAVEAQEMERLFLQVRRKLDEQGRWLLIFDNADPKHDIFFFAADCGNGDLLLTTRNPDLKHIATIAVEELTPDEGALLLLRSTGRLRADQNLSEAAPGERTAAIQISQALENLPLALDLIGSYLRGTNGSLSTFLQEYERNRIDYLRHTDETAIPFWNTSVFGTLSKAIRQVAGPRAVALLRACAFLAPDAIPESLFTGSPACWRDPLGASAAKPYEWNSQVLAPCFSLSLLRRRPGKRESLEDSEDSPDAPAFSVHRLVQEAIRHRLSDAQKRAITAQIACAANALLPDPTEPGARVDFDRLWPQAAVAVALCEEQKVALPAQRTSKYSLRQFAQDLRVQHALRDGSSWEALFESKELSYSALYGQLHGLERAQTKQRIRRIIASLLRVCHSEQEAQVAFCCMFFLVHYWWDFYLRHDDFSRPLLNIWRRQAAAADSDPFLSTLVKFQTEYPAERDWQHRDARREKWQAVGQQIGTLRELLGLEGENARAATPARAYVKGITNIYLTKVLRVIPGFRWGEGGGQPSLQDLYEESARLFGDNRDHFHLNWAFYEWGEGLLHLGRIDEAEERCRAALEGILRNAAEEPEESAPDEGDSDDADSEETNGDKGFSIDSELIANCYRLSGDLCWADPPRRPQAWSHYCAAVLAAWAFILSEQDDYSREFYGEQIERLQGRLDEARRQGPDEIGAIEAFVAEFWGPYRQSQAERAALPPGLFPRQPTTEELKTEGDGLNPYLGAIRDVLDAMPATLERLRESPLYSDPACFDAVLENFGRLAAASVDA